MLVTTTLPGPDNLWHWLGNSVTGKRTIWLLTDVHFGGRNYKKQKGCVIAASKNIEFRTMDHPLHGFPLD